MQALNNTMWIMFASPAKKNGIKIMSITHIPFYPSDWLAGTRGMMADETGVYITLTARMYEMAGPIERDDERLYRVCGCKTKRAFVKILDYLISEGKVFEASGELFNKRIEKEIKKVVEKSSKARAAAQERWETKSNKNNTTTDADAMRTHRKRICQPEPEPKPESSGGDSSAREVSETSTDREQILEAMGHDKSGMTATGKLVGNPADMLELKRWADLKLSMPEIIAVVSNVSQQKPGPPPVTFNYFSKAMARFAGEKSKPALKPEIGDQNGKRNYSNGQTRGDAQTDEAIERAIRIGRAGRTPRRDIF